MEDRWDAPDLSGRVGVVAGATRGVGRGIAEVLGWCGWTRTEDIIASFEAGNYQAVRTRDELHEKTVSP